MDPVSALGVAAAAVQFLQFSLQVLDTCRQIRDDAASSTQQNRDLEEAVRSLRSARKELEVSSQTKVPRRIVDVARDCVKSSDDLLDLLEHVRGARKQVSTAKAVYRAMREKRTIEKLENAIKAKQETLNHLLVQGIWTRAELLAIEQSTRFKKLNERVQGLTEQLIKQKEDLSKGLTALDLSLDSRLNDLKDATTQGFHQAEHHAKQRSEDVRKHVDHRLDEAEAAHQRERFLDSLFFPDIETRRSQVSDAAPNTLEWILGEGEVPTEVKWDDFVDWLHGSGSYWICGKAGSGKSTLMAHLVDDDRVREELREWSQGNEVFLCWFYFWRAGSRYQNSTTGLLRTLLYQVCLQRPELIQPIMTHLLITAERIPTWTVKTLLSSISEALHAATNTYFCIFVDGLDEFEGDYAALIDLIFGIRKLANVKFCLSSRPEVQLSTRLNDCKKLFLHDLNHHDIKAFTYQHLGKVRLDSNIERRLAEQISLAAEGVFLWASLVVRDTVRGLELGDDVEILDRRIQSLPGGIEELFATMIKSVDPIYRVNLALYLQVMLLTSDKVFLRSVGILTTMVAFTDPSADVSFPNRCAQTERRISGHSAGLLEVRTTRRAAPVTWKLYPPGSDKSPRVEHCHNTNHADTEPSDTVEEFSPLLFYESRYMSWIHRSAYDFVKTSYIQELIGQPTLGKVEMLTMLCDAALKHLSTAPSLSKVVNPAIYIGPTSTGYYPHTTNWRLREIMDFIRDHYDHYQVWADSKLDDLQRLLTQFDPCELCRCQAWPLPKRDSNLSLSVTAASDFVLAYFWVLCVDRSLLEYMKNRLTHILHRSPQSIAVSTWLKRQSNHRIPTFFSICTALAKSVCAQRDQKTQLMLVLKLFEPEFTFTAGPFEGMSFLCDISDCEGDEIVSRISIIVHLIFASIMRDLDEENKLHRPSTEFLEVLERDMKVCVGWYLECQHLSFQLPLTTWLDLRNYDSSGVDTPANPFAIRIVVSPETKRYDIFDYSHDKELFSHSNNAEPVLFLNNAWGCFKPDAYVLVELEGRALELLWALILEWELSRTGLAEPSETRVEECLTAIIEYIQMGHQGLGMGQQMLAMEYIETNFQHFFSRRGCHQSHHAKDKRSIYV